MEIPSPFLLLPDTGQLLLNGFQTTLGPRLSVSEFQGSDLFPFAARDNLFPKYEPAYQINFLKLQDGRWVYLYAGFQLGLLARLGFGWGTLREYGFRETTRSENQEQWELHKLAGISAWPIFALFFRAASLQARATMGHG